MPTLLQPEHATHEAHSPQRPLAEDNPLDPSALSALREFFLILDAWDRAEEKKLSADMQSAVDNPSYQAQGEPNIGARSRRVK
jgi:hypothetical protein